jgi:hypothetical protein
MATPAVGEELIEAIGDATGLPTVIGKLIVSITPIPDTINFTQAIHFLRNGRLGIMESFGETLLLADGFGPPTFVLDSPKKLLWGLSNTPSSLSMDSIFFKKCDVPEICEFIEVFQDVARAGGVNIKPPQTDGKTKSMAYEDAYLETVSFPIEVGTKLPLSFPILEARRRRYGSNRQLEYRPVRLMSDQAWQYLWSGARIMVYLGFSVTPQDYMKFHIHRIELHSAV